MASSAFRAVCLLLVALALCQGAVAAPDMTPAQQIRGAFVDITALSDTLRIKAAKINDPVGGLLILSGTVAPGFTQITCRVSAATAMLASTPPLGAADAKMVMVALTAFVRVHQALLDVVIGKSGLLARVPILSPVREAVVALEAAVDTFATALIDVIPTEEEAADAQFAALRVMVTKAQAAYEAPLSLKLRKLAQLPALPALPALPIPALPALPIPALPALPIPALPTLPATGLPATGLPGLPALPTLPTSGLPVPKVP